MFGLACCVLSQLHLDNLTGGLDISSGHALQDTLANQHKATTRSSWLMANAFVVQGKGPNVSGIQQSLRQLPTWFWLLLLSSLPLICW